MASRSEPWLLFETAEEAALHVARTPEGQAAAALPPPMAAKGALAQAGAEGLTLTRSDLQSGFRNVYVTHNKKTAVPRKGAGRRQACHLGYTSRRPRRRRCTSRGRPRGRLPQPCRRR